jgi:hypothetical protein
MLTFDHMYSKTSLRLFPLLLSVFFAASVAACSSEDEPQQPDTEGEGEATETAEADLSKTCRPSSASEHCARVHGRCVCERPRPHGPLHP